MCWKAVKNIYKVTIHYHRTKLKYALHCQEKNENSDERNQIVTAIVRHTATQEST